MSPIRNIELEIGIESTGETEFGSAEEQPNEG